MMPDSGYSTSCAIDEFSAAGLTSNPTIFASYDFRGTIAVFPPSSIGAQSGLHETDMTLPESVRYCNSGERF